MKIALVSDIHHFSVLDMYNGYLEGFQQLGVECHGIPIHNIIQELPRKWDQNIAFQMALGQIVNKMNGYTHVLYISGLSAPEWMLASRQPNIKYGLIAADDPHASTITLEQRKKYFDYYFTNEKVCEDKKKKIFYLPTASTSKLPVNIPQEQISERYDFVFVGTIYKDREKPLEEICKYCEDNGLTIKIIGPHLKTAPDSIIRRHSHEGIIPNNQSLLLYRGAKCVINIDRNINWHPMFEDGNPTLVKTKEEPYSPNPRVYEVAGCQTPQLYITPRKGVTEVFGDNIYYCGYDNVIEGVKNVLEDTDENRKTKIKNCYDIVQRNHLYVHRANSLLNYVKGVDNNVY